MSRPEVPLNFFATGPNEAVLSGQYHMSGCYSPNWQKKEKNTMRADSSEISVDCSINESEQESRLE